MQICMKLSIEARVELRKSIAKAYASSGLNYSEISRICRVHTSQVSRICRGQFDTLSANVVQVCKALGMAVETVESTSRATEGDPFARALTDRILALWDKTPGDAERLARLLSQLEEFRGKKAS